MPDAPRELDRNYISRDAVGMERGAATRVPADCAGLRFDQALARLFPEHSRSRLTAWIRAGRALLDAQAAAPDSKVWGGEAITISMDDEPRDAPPRGEAIALAVVHEDAAVLVINKPAGLVTHPGNGNWNGTLLNALLHHAPALAGVPRAGIVHRLDKDTTGLLVVAKTLEAQTSLVRELQARTVERVYLALARGRVAGDGEVDSPIGRDPRNRVRMAVVPGGKPALTRFRVLKRFDQATLLECRLATGRTHQIRVHLQSIGHPLVGDPVYRRAVRATAKKPSSAGAAVLDETSLGRQALHAARLAFIHPASGERVEFTAPLPEDFAQLLATLEQ